MHKDINSENGATYQHSQKEQVTLPLTNTRVLEIAKQHNIILNRESFSINDSGLDFRVIFAKDSDGQQWVLRLPRRLDVIPTAQTEKKILDTVGTRLSIQTPDWDIFSKEMIAYKLLNGVPTGMIDSEAKEYVWKIDEKNVPSLYLKSLGEALAELHNIEQNDAKRAGLTVIKPEELKLLMKRRMEKVKSVYGVSDTLWERWQKWLANDTIWPEQTVLIHGDFHPGHILISEDARVTGIIDWTEARVDDPSHDFAAIYLTFGEKVLEKLIEYYRLTGAYVWPSMKEHIMELTAAYPVSIAEFAIKSGIKEYEEYAKHSLGVNS
ncbi:phosphotransferase [Gracilibacillus oryzae]|uniref:Phosphotransferase n=1 Tax=Gracilibacillus oryzae TaxID=1672701 RepID=A0A7C8KUH0_9BACI|nr:phosphotransferase [Gracilibacillus oryzae]